MLFDWGDATVPYAIGWRQYDKKSIYGSITSFARAKVFISEYLWAVRKLSKIILSFLKEEDGDGFDNKSVKKTDVKFLFIRSIDEAFEEDVVELAEEALVNVCHQVDNDYAYTINDESENDDESEEDDVVNATDDGGIVGDCDSDNGW